MKSMVVLFAVVAVACGSYVPLAQPAHLPALVLDPHGRPLDTAEVINSRALHLQAKALEGHYGHYGYGVAPYAHSAALAYPAYSHASPLLGHSAFAPHYLYKRSLGHYAYAAPAVSHQSRVDVIASPHVVSHAVAAPVLAHAAVLPVAHHGAIARINHAAVAPIAHGAVPTYNAYHGYNAAPLVHAW